MERTAAYLIPGADLGAAVELARSAEAWGYESLWVTHSTTGRDSFLVLSAYAHATRTIGLGNGVVPIYPRHPVVMAQEALALAEISGGRFRLGIGVSHRPPMEGALGLAMGKPIQAMREYVAVLRAALAGQVEHTGPGYRVSWKTTVLKPPARPPVLLAALSPRMCELAGEIADGAVLWLCPPAYVREVALPALARGRQKAGKSLDGFEVVAAVPIALTDRVADTRALFKEELVRYLQLPFYRAMLTGSGFGEELAAFDRDRGKAPSPGRAVPDSLAGALGGIGGKSALRDYVAAYRQAGVTLPAVRPIAFPDSPHYRPTLEACAPELQSSGRR
ncbi:MAG: LLM class flavin-dependent oxidoreductase [Candidatus Rokubacteria bacterium]|nr:LLM class flavin-dependent oxidoreductase [Candidatus Rokubacteria bacterium]